MHYDGDVHPSKSAAQHLTVVDGSTRDAPPRKKQTRVPRNEPLLQSEHPQKKQRVEAPASGMAKPSEHEVYKQRSGRWCARLHKNENGRGKSKTLGRFGKGGKGRSSAVAKWRDAIKNL